MAISKKEVIKLLNKLNLRGVKEGDCGDLVYNNEFGPRTLAKNYFPDAKTRQYLQRSALLKVEHDRFLQEAAEAKKIRDQKNAVIEDDSSDDISG